MYGAYYIDIATKTYSIAHSDAHLAPIVEGQGLKYDDFREIHNIFKRRVEELMENIKSPEMRRLALKQLRCVAEV